MQANTPLMDGREANGECSTSNNFFSDSSSSTALLGEEKMRRKLQFFFMNPIEKWRAKRRFPYKFVVQLIKIVLVTIQLCLFAHNSYNYVNYTWDNRVTFSHLFLMGWDATREVNAYPPAIGPLAIYVEDDFYKTIKFAYDGYANLKSTIGPYSYASEDNVLVDPRLCMSQYREGTVFGFNESYIFDAEIVDTCINITKDLVNNLHSLNISFSALVRASLSFAIKTVNLKAAGPITPPDCYKFDVKITFDNQDHDGQILLDLEAEPVRLLCKGNIKYVTDNKLDSVLRSILNYLVIFICFASLGLCSRAIYRAIVLRNITVDFFRRNYGQDLSPEGRMEFINFWYIMIIANDILIILGSCIKEEIEKKQFLSDQWNVCSVFLGTGNMLVWFGVLRYLGFFKTYNVVILTLKKAAPKVARFLLCAVLIYAGFTFCGWLILGPYHLKFRSISTTSECLFSLLNGDDMFATFSIMSQKSAMLWWYSRIYLYSFISLYIYVVLSLFISVIMDAYDTIKKYYKDGFPKNDLQMFVGTANMDMDLDVDAYRSDAGEEGLTDIVKGLCCCRHLRRSYASLCETKPAPRTDQTEPLANCI